MQVTNYSLARDLREARTILSKLLPLPSPAARERESAGQSPERQRLEFLLERAERTAREQETRESSLVRAPLSDMDFNALFNAVRHESINREVEPVQLVAKSAWFTCAQLRVLVKAVASRNEAPLALTVYPRLTDPQRFFTLEDAFTTMAWRTIIAQLGVSR